MQFAGRLSGIALLLTALLILTGCCTFRSCQVKDSIEINASQQLNSCGETGQHPVTIRIISLAGTSAFNSASFDELWQSGEKILGEDRISMIEVVVMPGQNVILDPVREDDVTAIGILVNYCRLEPDCWRKTIAVENDARTIKLWLDQTCISIR